jgi:hypothetical protein
MNIIALQSASRVPEIVSWYYQYQSDIFESTSFLANEVEVDLLASSMPGKGVAKQSFKFLIAVEFYVFYFLLLQFLISSLISS